VLVEDERAAGDAGGELLIQEEPTAEDGDTDPGGLEGIVLLVEPSAPYAEVVLFENA
jgi:hypothetical protein